MSLLNPKMKRSISAIAIIGISMNVLAQNKIEYPKTKKVDQTDDYFGIKVPDPYRWLEDDRSAETAEWVKTENALTNSYLEKIPYRNKVKERLTKIWNFEKQSAPFRKKNYFFFYKNDGIQNQSVLYVRDGENGPARVLLDPNKLAADGTASLNGLGISKNAKYLAYAVARAGSDWNEINIIEISTGKLLPEKIEWVKFSDISWKEDEGFFYSHYDAPEKGKEYSRKNEFHKVAFHKIGDDVKNDKLIYEDKNFPLRNFGASLTDDGKYLVLSTTESTTGNALKVMEMREGLHNFVELVADFKNDWRIVDNIGSNLFIITNERASNNKLIAVDMNKPDVKAARVILPETEDLLESVTLCDGKLICNYLHNVSSLVKVFDINGKLLQTIGLPGIGKVESIHSDIKDKDAYFEFTTFTSPASIYKYSVADNKLTLLFKPKVDFKSEDYETKQVFYPSRDGKTKIPMFLTYKKGMKQDGNNPTFMFGYGGFSSYYAPEFRIDRCLFLEQGGIYVIPGIRGGGEYGEKWHEAGTILNKQNVFNDFIDAAEYLFKEKYTNPKKLAIHGRSNGGLLIGAVMTQRPDIAAVAIPTVGVLDMLRFHKFTIGWAWVTDYGCSEKDEQFQCLFKYSPLHNVKRAVYPATLITTGDHDDRVVPAHSFKFAATLQENNIGPNPTLIRIDTNAGHGSGKPTGKQIEEFADIWSFVFFNLGMAPQFK